jgi:hypothetical protein
LQKEVTTEGGEFGGRSHHILPSFGPFEIISIMSPVTVKNQLEEGASIVHASRLKYYRSRPVFLSLCPCPQRTTSNTSGQEAAVTRSTDKNPDEATRVAAFHG